MLDRWLACVAQLESEIPAQQFKPWIKPLVYLGYDESERVLRLGVPNHFKLNWVKSQFESRIEAIARNAIDEQLSVRFEIHRPDQEPVPARHPAANGTEIEPTPDETDEFGLESLPAGSQNPATPRFPQPSSAPDNDPFVADPFTPDFAAPDTQTRLRPELTFDSFVHGKANQMAWSAALQVVERPGTSYNPLFLYGGVGLGKTHLLHAVGNSILERSKRARVRYIHAQDYFDEMVRAIQRKSIQDFKRKYQQLDLLLVDDIQFLGGKERTQEEFFYTFEALLSARKQLIITSDTYPKELSAFEDRLVSRFGSGLIVEIEPPELEMRVAILLKKAEQSGEKLPEEVAYFIAKNLRSNVRELEGALLRVIAFARFRGRQLSVDLAREALKDLLELSRPPISIESIQKTVADFFKIKTADMYSKRRPAHIARARQVAMYFAKELTQKSFPEIGEAFGGRDHTTVMHAVKRIAELRQHDQEWNRQLHVLEQTLRG
ncbi:chromosomal replication initiator protein DnaA [Burkholderiaceae bacterium FT117]|uniref:chromosomal replication initiator protein DnaA n=1 Tax=Zeimonas sediminis TaxID=2944268 RepID=UPI002342C86B|nr:chromosomal replication initiator protein DnaA [Zeimonas sediminis]MCM5571239.1 chromosomal replication initiator protein DnaA [Zeimonas sediminis]